MSDLYDGVFRTVVSDCKNFLLPFINEVFGESYEGSEIIQFHPNEHFIDQQDEADIRRITDTNFTVIGKEKKHYHLECESSVYNKGMLIRIFEYDAQIALDQAELEREIIKVTFPHTAVLYLRSNSKTPNEIKIVIETPGGSVEYGVPVVKMTAYRIADIFEKRLYMLLPFYIFTHEKTLNECNTDEKKLEKLKKEYQEIVEHLDELTKKEEITSFEKRTLMELSNDVLKKIAQKYEKVQEGVGEIMCGALIETEARTILLQGLQQGRSEGLQQGRSEGLQQGRSEGFTEGSMKGRLMDIKNLMDSVNWTAEQAMDALKIPKEERAGYLEKL